MAAANRLISVIIPASNEESYLPDCLASLLASEPPHLEVEVIVVSNGSRDRTAEVAGSFERAMAAKGWGLTVLDLTEGSKRKALNAGDAAARGELRVYMDADMTVSPRLLAGLARAVDRPEAAYAGGLPSPLQPSTAALRAYTRLWTRLPFMVNGVPGCGLSAVNGPGRARWGDWPQIIADDLFARLNFAPWERHLVPEPYSFPMASDLPALVRVRRRQDRGVSEVATTFPDLAANEDKGRMSLSGAVALLKRDPIGFLVYAGVSLAVKAGSWDGTWSRAR
jgi:glycosyltransferase involved in cell wall biosynthesis